MQLLEKSEEWFETALESVRCRLQDCSYVSPSTRNVVQKLLAEAELAVALGGQRSVDRPLRGRVTRAARKRYRDSADVVDYVMHPHRIIFKDAWFGNQPSNYAWMVPLMINRQRDLVFVARPVLWNHTTLPDIITFVPGRDIVSTVTLHHGPVSGPLWVHAQLGDGTVLVAAVIEVLWHPRISTMVRLPGRGVVETVVDKVLGPNRSGAGVIPDLIMKFIGLPSYGMCSCEAVGFAPPLRCGAARSLGRLRSGTPC